LRRRGSGRIARAEQSRDVIGRHAHDAKARNAIERLPVIHIPGVDVEMRGPEMIDHRGVQLRRMQVDGSG